MAGNNSTNITSLNTSVTSNTTDITSFNTSVTSNTTDITSLTTLVGNNSTNITSLNTSVTSNTTDITSLNTSVSSNTTNITSLTTLAGNNSTNITSLITNKQENITAGTGLSFSGTTLNAEVTQSELNEKQTTLTTGSNILINGNTISSTNTTYNAAGNGGLVLSGTDFSLDLSNLTADQVLTRKLTIKTTGAPQLIIKPNADKWQDGGITIRGARNQDLTKDPAQLRFENYDDDSGGMTRELFRITGRVTNTTTNIGGFILHNFTDGISSSGALTMDSNGNFNMGNGTTFQNDYKLSINGVLNTYNISTNGTTNPLFIGNSSVSGEATATNSYSWLELKTDKCILAGGWVELRHSNTSSNWGTTGVKVESTKTTIYNELHLEDKVKVGVVGARSTNGSLEPAVLIEKGLLLMDAETGNGLTSGNGVIQINCSDVGKMKDGICMRAYNNYNNCINFRSESDSARGRIDGNGSSSILYRTSSDVRLKENIENMESCWDLLKRTIPKKFTWITDQTQDVGFIAQDIYAEPGFYPLKPIIDKYNGCDNSLNTFEDDGYCEFPMESDGVIYPHALDYGRFTPYLWKALQEAIIKIDTLEIKVTELEEKITVS